MANLGARLTGNKDEEDAPLRDIVGSAGRGIDSILPQDPQSRAALMQIGLGLMQPMAFGQTTGGHIGQAIGGGGEAVSRGTEEELKARKVQNELEKAQESMDLRQQQLEETKGYHRLSLEQMRQNQEENRALRAQGEGRRTQADEAYRKQQEDVMVANEIEALRKAKNDIVKPDPTLQGATDEQLMARAKANVAALRGTTAAPPTTAAPTAPNEVKQNGWVYDRTTGKAIRKAE